MDDLLRWGRSGALCRGWLNTTVRSSGPNTQISDLPTDGEHIFGAGWASRQRRPPTRELRGQFGAHILTGELNWAQRLPGRTEPSCAGRRRSTLPPISRVRHRRRWRPETNPRTWQWALAMDKRHGRGLTTPTAATADWDRFQGRPASQFLHWLPTFSPGHLHDQRPGGLERRGEQPVRRLRGRVPPRERRQPAGVGAVRPSSSRPTTTRSEGYPRCRWPRPRRRERCGSSGRPRGTAEKRGSPTRCCAAPR